MVATNGKTQQRPAKRRGEKRSSPPLAAAGTPDVASSQDISKKTVKRPPRLVDARDAARQVRDIAALCTNLDVRGRLRRLAAVIRRGLGNVQRQTFVEATLGDCLDDAATRTGGDRWLLCEAATWALAWMARSRRAGGSAGGLLERLVREGRGCRGTLADRDTQPARFVLTLARLFADIEACRCLEADASTALVEEIMRLASADGTVGLTGSTAMVDRVVRWTTARELGRLTGGIPWDTETDHRWAAAATAAVRLLGSGGRELCGAGRLPACFTAPLLVAVGRGGDVIAKSARRTARLLRKGGGADADAKLLPRAMHDPAAAVAVIRTGWQKHAVRVLLDYRDATPRLEIAAHDRMLVEGTWQWQVSLHGKPLEAEAAWSVSGWESDRQASFLEISAPLGHGLHINRQIVVVPDERIVLLADAITTTAAAGDIPSGTGLEYRGLLPLVPPLDTDMAEETREICVYDTAMRCMALPLALPEWTAAGGGRFSATPEGLVLEQRTAARRLYAPVWLDCDPARVGGPLTWRQLTVADTRMNLPPHQAVGYRVQAGLRQWLVYQSLDSPRNRTLLGCNVSCDFLFGRIKRSGEVARTLEIQ
jgi:hypothetical protein